MINTSFTNTYGCTWPIVSAGMAFVARAPLAAAVSEGGGFGMLGATAMPPELLDAEIAAIRAATENPFGVNFIPRFGAAEQIALCIERDISVVSFYWDPPENDWVEDIHEAGGAVWIQVGSIDEAVDAVSLGADLLIVQGVEGGGHNRSTASTFTLLPGVIDAVGTAPVLAAGGIADGRGLAAALSLGAVGGWIGTRFVASVEADAHAEYKDRITGASIESTLRHTTFGFDFPDASVRGLRNTVVNEFEGQESPYAGLDPETLPVVGTANLFGQEVPMAKFTGFPPTAAATGDLDQMSLLAGEAAGLITSLSSAGDITRSIGLEAETILRNGAALISEREPELTIGAIIALGEEMRSPGGPAEATAAYNNAFIDAFRSHDGAMPGDLSAVPWLLLTTKGAKTGRSHTTPVAHVQRGNQHFVIASKGGASSHPAWFHNLRANSDVIVEFGEQTVDATARVLGGEERNETFEWVTSNFEVFAMYQAQTDRPLPVIELVLT